MTLPTFRVPGVPVDLLDVGNPDLTDAQVRQVLDGLTQVHMRHFYDYPHMPAEFEKWRMNGWDDPGITVLNWMVWTDAPHGMFIVHVNRRRGVALFHFWGVDLEVRSTLPHGWLGHLCDAFEAAGQAACDGRLRVIMCEVPDEHVHKWVRIGFEPVPMRYGEPAGGRTATPPYRYIRQNPMLKRLDRVAPAGDLAQEAVSAFLLDYYLLPPDEPEVLRMLNEARAYGQ